MSGPRVNLPHLIGILTGRDHAADTFHLRGRGRIEPGTWADLVVFDPANVNDRATFEDPGRFPDGIGRVFVNGKPVAENGRVLQDRPGRVLRRGV